MYNRHHLNLEAFAEPLSAEAKYWLGFLMADGCVSKGYICLKLKFEDAEHVRRFARFVGVCEESVREFFCDTTYGRAHGVQLKFCGKELVMQLAEYGIVPRKTWTALVPPTLKQSPDFWRGLTDGDGSVARDTRGYNYIALCGTLAIVQGFTEACYIVTGLRPAFRARPSIYQTGLSSAKATKLLHWLYYPGAVALERKASTWAR